MPCPDQSVPSLTVEECSERVPVEKLIERLPVQRGAVVR